MSQGSATRSDPNNTKRDTTWSHTGNAMWSSVLEFPTFRITLDERRLSCTLLLILPPPKRKAARDKFDAGHMAETASHLECQINSHEATNALMAVAGWDRVGVAATTASGAVSAGLHYHCQRGCVTADAAVAPRLHHNRGSWKYHCPASPPQQGILGIGVLAPHHKHG